MNKKIILLIIGVISIIAIIILIYFFRPLKMTDISPSDKEKDIGIDQKISISFNKKVSAENFSITSHPVKEFKLSESNNSLVIIPTDNFSPNTSYTITINSKKSFTDISETKTNQHTWQFTTGTGSVEEIFDTNFDEFYAKYPLAEFLPHRTDHYKIEGPDEDDSYTIILYAIFNAGINGPPIEEQEKVYKEELRNYKNEALEWIISKDIDPNSLKLQWIPKEAKDL